MMMPDEIKSGPLKAAYSMFDDSWTIYIDRGESRPGLLSPAPIKAVELCKQGARQTIFLNIKDKDQDVTLVTPFWINAGWEVNHEKVLEMAASVHTLQAVISETDKACKDCPHFLECKGL